MKQQPFPLWDLDWSNTVYSLNDIKKGWEIRLSQSHSRRFCNWFRGFEGSATFPALHRFPSNWLGPPVWPNRTWNLENLTWQSVHERLCSSHKSRSCWGSWSGPPRTSQQVSLCPTHCRRFQHFPRRTFVGVYNRMIVHVHSDLFIRSF